MRKNIIVRVHANMTAREVAKRTQKAIKKSKRKQ
jgi:hypothetical protein